MRILNDFEKAKCLEDSIYRINCLMAYDLYVFIQKKYNNANSVYATGHLLEPALQGSLIFGRQILEFLQIKKSPDDEKLYCTKGNGSDITISMYNPKLKTHPLDDELTRANEIHLIRLIHLAHKTAAHYTPHIPSQSEKESLAIARLTIYDLMNKYIPEISNHPLNWKERDKFLDAIQK